METEKQKMTKNGLQLRMTIFVTSAVLLVSALLLIFMGGFIRKNYIQYLEERIADNLTAISQSIEQRILRIEDTANTMSSIATAYIGDRKAIDSLLALSIRSIPEIIGVSMVMRKGYFPDVNGAYEQSVYKVPSYGLIFSSIVHDERIDTNAIWISSFIEGKRSWSEPVKDADTGDDLICYITPQCNSNGERVGGTYSYFPLKALTSFVTSYKIRKDIDISAITSNGDMVVLPDEYILQLPPEDLIVRERIIDHLGWKIVLSADRAIIEKEVRESMITLLLLMLLLFIVMSLTIRLSVKYVATPFIKKQRIIEKEKAIMDNELMLAASAQNELVPHTFPPFPERNEIDIAACIHPARNVGGDLYDYFLNGDRLYFCIGDVSGKGIQASLFMAAAHYLFRSIVAGMPANEAVSHMNTSLCADNERCRFVTFWFGTLNLSCGTLEYVNAGHDSPILFTAGRTRTLSESENMPLGIWDEAEFISGTHQLETGDILFLYTDGVTEAMDTEGREFGKKALFDIVSASGCDKPGEVIDNILTAVRNHASGADQSDDITMLCIKYNGTNKH